MMLNLLVIGIFGFLGAITRFWVGTWGIWVYFPVLNATLIINIVGSFLLAVFLGGLMYNEKIPIAIRTGITTGFIGSFTTFSTFMIDIYSLSTVNYLLAITYLILSIILSFIVAVFGYRMSRNLVAIYKKRKRLMNKKRDKD